MLRNVFGMFVVVLLNCDHHQCNDHQLKKICLKVDKNWHRGDCDTVSSNTACTSICRKKRKKPEGKNLREGKLKKKQGENRKPKN